MLLSVNKNSNSKTDKFKAFMAVLFAHAVIFYLLLHVVTNRNHATPQPIPEIEITISEMMPDLPEVIKEPPPKELPKEKIKKDNQHPSSKKVREKDKEPTKQEKAAETPPAKPTPQPQETPPAQKIIAPPEPTPPKAEPAPPKPEPTPPKVEPAPPKPEPTPPKVEPAPPKPEPTPPKVEPVAKAAPEGLPKEDLARKPSPEGAPKQEQAKKQESSEASSTRPAASAPQASSKESASRSNAKDGASQSSAKESVSSSTAPPGPVDKVVIVLARIDAKIGCQKPVYPQASLQLEEEGTVRLGFLVAADGTIQDSRIEKTSGFKRLDEAAKDALALCKFTPRTENGVAVSSWAHLIYVWHLH